MFLVDSDGHMLRIKASAKHTVEKVMALLDALHDPETKKTNLHTVNRLQKLVLSDSDNQFNANRRRMIKWGAAPTYRSHTDAESATYSVVTDNRLAFILWTTDDKGAAEAVAQTGSSIGSSGGSSDNGGRAGQKRASPAAAAATDSTPSKMAKNEDSKQPVQSEQPEKAAMDTKKEDTKEEDLKEEDLKEEEAENRGGDEGEVSSYCLLM